MDRLCHSCGGAEKTEIDGIGFVMPSGYFLLDVDHRDVDDPMMKELTSLFPTYLEHSPSGNGFHFYGRVDLTRIPQSWDAENSRWKLDGKYYTKNTRLGLELYIGGLTNRFATFTGNTEGRSEQITECTDAVLFFLDKYMLRPETQRQKSKSDDRFITLTEEDIPDVIDALRCQQNGEKFAALFDNGDTGAYGSASEADAALCAMIVFRTGPDAALIDAIFRESALFRDKWDRQDYNFATISAGIASCQGVFHHSLRKKPPFILNDGKKLIVSAPRLADYVRTHLKYIFVREAQRGSYQKYVYHPLLTEAIKATRDDVQPWDYSNEADMINRIVLGMTAKQYREQYGIPKNDSIRPHMTKDEADLMQRLQIMDVGLQYSTPDFQERKRKLEWFANWWREEKKKLPAA